MKDKKEKKILQAALNLFIERGFHDTPTSLIAKKADVATGTLFHYFKSKEDLINELYLDAKNSLFQELIKEIGEETPDEEKLELLWMNLVKCGLKSPREFKFYQQFSNSPFITNLTHEQISNQCEFLKQIINKLLKKGIFKTLDIGYIMDYFYGHCITTISHLINHPEKVNQENLDKYYQFCWDGIMKR